MKISLPELKTFMFGRYGGLLLTLFILLLLQPTIDTQVGKFLLEVMFVVSLFAGLRAIETKKGLLRFEVVLLLVSLGLTYSGSVLDNQNIFMLGIAGRGLFLSLVALTILLHLFHPQKVSSDTLAGAVCVYLLIGVIFAYCFLIIEFMVPGSFSFTQGEGRLNLWVSQDFYPFFYFSMITMTTVGYGDMLPITTMARTFTTFEAIIGQVYLTILVARLVGMHLMNQSTVEENDASDV